MEAIIKMWKQLLGENTQLDVDEIGNMCSVKVRETDPNLAFAGNIMLMIRNGIWSILRCIPKMMQYLTVWKSCGMDV